MASHPFVLPVSSFVVMYFFSDLLSLSMQPLQHFIFSIMKQNIYATNRKKKKITWGSQEALLCYSL